VTAWSAESVWCVGILWMKVIVEWELSGETWATLDQVATVQAGSVGSRKGVGVESVGYRWSSY